MREDRPADDRIFQPGDDEAAHQDNCQFPANLTRNEYIDFNILVARTTGALRNQKVKLVLLLLMLAVGVTVMVVAKYLYQYVSVPAVVLLAVLMGLAVVLYGGMPGHIRRAAARAYDQTVRTGYTYYGIISVMADRMTKESRFSQVTIQYGGQAMFIESPDMLILSEPGNRSIVIPARCLTEADSRTIRSLVEAGLGKERCRSYGRLFPRAAARMQRRSEEPDTTAQLVLDVQYTPREFVGMVTGKTLMGFTRALPVYGSIAILLGLLTGLLSSYYWGMLIFIGIMVFTLLWAVFLPWLRVRLSVRRMPAEARILRISFSERGMVITSPGRTERLEYIWPMIARAVERDDAVEFEAGNAFLRIPKRCIPDLQLLKSIVDRYME